MSRALLQADALARGFASFAMVVEHAAKLIHHHRLLLLSTANKKMKKYSRKQSDSASRIPNSRVNCSPVTLQICARDLVHAGSLWLKPSAPRMYALHVISILGNEMHCPWTLRYVFLMTCAHPYDTNQPCVSYTVGYWCSAS